MGGVRLQVLKRLILEYQQTNDSKLFERILLRIDDLLVKVVMDYQSKRPPRGPTFIRWNPRTCIIPP